MSRVAAHATREHRPVGAVRSPLGRLVSAALVAAPLAALLLAPAREGAFAAPQGTWASYTKGLEVRGITCLRISSKGPETWYASIQGNADTRRGFCDSRDKGKTWTSRRSGFDDMTSERDAFEISLDPKDEKTVWVATQGKIYRSTNFGQAFEAGGNGTLTFAFDRSQSRSTIAGVVVDPSNPKHILAGSSATGFEGGLFESVDGGKSWTQIAGTGDRKDLQDTILGHEAWPISLDSRSDKFVIVGSRGSGVWASDDRGRHFKRTDPRGAGPHTVYDLTQMQGREAWLAESRGLWRTRDGGDTWGKDPALTGACLSVDVDPNNRKIVYAIVRGQGLFRTENLTAWEGPKHPEVDPHAVLCHPHARNTIFVLSRTTGLWISTDRGETLNPVASEPPFPGAVPAIHHVAIHPADATKALAVTDTGLTFVSANRGSTWLRGGNLMGRVQALVPDASTPGAWLAGGHGVWRTLDDGGTWTRVLKPDDVEDRVVSLQRAADGTWLALWERDGRLSGSKDGGATWGVKHTERATPSRGAWASALALDPVDAKRMYVAMRTTAERSSANDKDGGVYESLDGGATWRLLDAGLRGEKGAHRDGWNFCAALALDATSGRLLLGLDGVGLFRYDPAAGEKAAWEQIPLAIAPDHPIFRAFLVVPRLAGGVASTTIVAQLEGHQVRGLLRSDDGGDTWGMMSDPGARLLSLSEDPAIAGRFLGGDSTGDRGVLAFEPKDATPRLPPTPPPVAPPAPTPVEPLPPDVEVPVAGLVAFAAGGDKAVRLYDLHEKKAIAAVPTHEGSVACVLLSRDESRLYSGGADKVVRIWDGSTGAALGRYEGHRGAVSALAQSADGTRLFAGDEEWKITVWDTGAGTAVSRFEGHLGGITDLALSSDGARLYSASRDRTVRTWDTATGKPGPSFGMHPAEVLAIALSPDGKRLFTAARDGKVRAFDVAAPEAPTATFETGLAVAACIALSPDGRVAFVGGDGDIVLGLSCADGSSVAKLRGAGTGTRCVALSRDGKWVVGGGLDGRVRLWAGGDGERDPLWRSGEDREGGVTALALTPDVAAPPTPAPAEPPAMGEPGTPEPGMSEPGMEEPGMGEPAMGEPGMDDETPPEPTPAGAGA